MNFEPTDAYPGSAEKLETMRLRAAMGLPLFHLDDRVDFSGLKCVPITTRQRKRYRTECRRVSLRLTGRKSLRE